MKINEIQDLIKFVVKSGVSEVQLELKDFKIVIKTPPKGKYESVQHEEQKALQAQVSVTPMPQAPVVPFVNAQQPAVESKKDDSAEGGAENLIIIKSPMIGTFYRSPEPEKPPFVNVGDEVKKGQVLCIIEAMKLFNEIEAEVAGKIVKVLAEDSTPVEYDQPMFLIEPH